MNRPMEQNILLDYKQLSFSAPPLALPVYTLVQDTLQKCSKPPATPHVRGS